MAEGSKSRLALDLDQIERQLRHSAQQSLPSKSDPLAELARIVGQDDPFRGLLAGERGASQNGAAMQSLQDPDSFASAHSSRAYGQPGTIPDAPHGVPHAYSPAAMTPEDEAILYGRPGEQYMAGGPAYDESDYPSVDGPEDAFTPVKPRRSRKRLIAVAAVFGIAVIGAAGALVVRTIGTSRDGGPPMIKAETGPSKVAPENPGGVDIPNQNKQIYERSLQDSQTRVVTREEQPIDIRQMGRASGGQASGPGAAPPPGAGSAGSGSLVGVLGEPRRVRTVSIRPDGTILGPEQVAGQRSGAPAAAPAPAPARQTMAPTPALPSTAAAMAPTGAPSAVVPPRPRDAVATPPQRTSATPSNEAQPGAPLQIMPDMSRTRGEARSASVAPSLLREPTETSAAADPNGGFAVQLTVRSSEGEARAAFDQLQQRHPIELSGFSPVIRQAEANGRTIYRVRVGPMSREDANSLCSRLKSNNGQCFVAAQ